MFKYLNFYFKKETLHASLKGTTIYDSLRLIFLAAVFAVYVKSILVILRCRFLYIWKESPALPWNRTRGCGHCD